MSEYESNWRPALAAVCDVNPAVWISSELHLSNSHLVVAKVLTSVDSMPILLVAIFFTLSHAAGMQYMIDHDRPSFCLSVCLFPLYLLNRLCSLCNWCIFYFLNIPWCSVLSVVFVNMSVYAFCVLVSFLCTVVICRADFFCFFLYPPVFCFFVFLLFLFWQINLIWSDWLLTLIMMLHA